MNLLLLGRKRPEAGCRRIKVILFSRGFGRFGRYGKEAAGSASRPVVLRL